MGKENRKTLTYQDIFISIRQIHVYLQQILNLPPGELTMLTTIDRCGQKNGRVLATDLVNELSLSRPAVSRMLHVLQKKKLVELRPNENDHRCIEVDISESGREILQEEYQECCKILEGIAENFGAEKMQRMVEYNYEFCNELAKLLEEKL